MQHDFHVCDVNTTLNQIEKQMTAAPPIFILNRIITRSQLLVNFHFVREEK